MLFNKELLPIYEGEMIGWNWQEPEQNAPVPYRSFYDHFVAKGQEVLMLTYQSVAAGAEKILTDHGFKCVFDKINPLHEHEPRFLAYRETTLPDTYQQKHSIVVCAGIKPEYTSSDIKQFCDYYFEQGVRKIFLYYLGRRYNFELLDIENVIYKPWDFSPDRLYMNRYRTLYSGPQMFESFAKKIGVHCDWSILVALDDFIQVKDKNLKLKHYLNSQKDTQSHIYCPFKHADFLNKKVIINHNRHTLGWETAVEERGRCILRGKLIDLEHRVRVYASHFAKRSKDLISANIGSSVYNPSEDPRNYNKVVYTRRKFY